MASREEPQVDDTRGLPDVPAPQETLFEEDPKPEETTEATAPPAKPARRSRGGRGKARDRAEAASAEARATEAPAQAPAGTEAPAAAAQAPGEQATTPESETATQPMAALRAAGAGDEGTAELPATPAASVDVDADADQGATTVVLPTATAEAGPDEDSTDKAITESGSARTRARRRRRAAAKARLRSVDTDEPKAGAATEATPTPAPARTPVPAERSTRLEASKARGTRQGQGADRGRRRRRGGLTEDQKRVLREGPERRMLVTEGAERTQIGVIEGRTLVEHYVTRKSGRSMVGNIYQGRVQNVLPGMEAAFVDIGKGRNAVLYAGEVNYNEEDLDGEAPRIEKALKPGQAILVQVTKDPIGAKGARLTTQVSLAGRYLVLQPEDSTFGISRRLPENERIRLREILKEVRPKGL